MFSNRVLTLVIIWGFNLRYSHHYRPHTLFLTTDDGPNPDARTSRCTHEKEVFKKQHLDNLRAEIDLPRAIIE